MKTYDLSKTSPDVIVAELISMCCAAADSGVIAEKPVYVEFKKVMWIVTYENATGEFAESFKTRKAAMEFMDGLLENGLAKIVHIRENVK